MTVALSGTSLSINNHPNPLRSEQDMINIYISYDLIHECAKHAQTCVCPGRTSCSTLQCLCQLPNPAIHTLIIGKISNVSPNTYIDTLTYIFCALFLHFHLDFATLGLTTLDYTFPTFWPRLLVDFCYTFLVDFSSPLSRLLVDCWLDNFLHSSYVDYSVWYIFLTLCIDFWYTLSTLVLCFPNMYIYCTFA